MAEQVGLALFFGAEAPGYGLRRRVFLVDAVDDVIELEGREGPIDRRTRRFDSIALAAEIAGNAQPTSKPGQPGGNHGPTRPTNLPLAFSSTTNMPAPCSAQCPAMTAAFRQPTSSLVAGLPSTVMNRAVPGSDSIAVFGAISALHHCRSFRRSVSTTGPLGRASVTPCLRGAIIATSSLQWMDTGRFISGSKGGAYHPRKIRLAIGLGKQQHAGIEMAVMDNGFVRIAGGEQYLQ